MRIRAIGDVLKVWLLAAVVVALGAWLAPPLFNAGKALAEVAGSRPTNGAVEWLGSVCRKADFPQFFTASVLLVAALLLFPWLRWLRPRCHEIAAAAVAKCGPWWRNIACGCWHGGGGFLLVAGVWFALVGGWFLTGNLLVPHFSGGWQAFALRALAGSLALAALLEWFFRGVVLGVFLRAMRPAAALGMNAVFFALTLTLIAPHGVVGADPEAANSGFRLLRLVAWRWCAWQGVCGILVPLLVLGLVLAHARWRTAALWLPIGLHAGWLFVRATQACLLDAGAPFFSGKSLPPGWIPAITIVVAGVLAQRRTPPP